MRYGICIGLSPEQVKICERAGSDYVETNFGSLTNASDEDFAAFKRAVDSSSIGCEAANCFIGMSMVGENVDYDAIRAYLNKGMERAELVGLKTAVFGSGRARSLPEGWPYRRGIVQLSYFLGEIVSPIAANHGITVVTEPLRAAESNVINRVKEGVMLAAFAGKDNIAGLADLFHMAESGDTYDDVRQLVGDIRHAHISNPLGDGKNKRTFPKSPDEYDYAGFIAALTYAGCERFSVEAGTTDFETDAFLAIKTLRSL